MSNLLGHIARGGASLLLAIGLWLMAAAPSYAQLGETVSNTAQVTFTTGSVDITLSTNAADFVIEAARTPSTIEFFRFAPNSTEGISVQVNGSQFSPSGNGNDFQPIGAPVTLGGLELDLSGDVMLAPATQFLPGELAFVIVTDLGQNGNPTAVETVVITIESDAGDEITLRLFETGPDTGMFLAFLPTSAAPSAPNDNVLTTAGTTVLTATYIDAFDTTEVSVDTAIIAPFGRVFDALSGELISGAQVTLIDAATGAPATVFGVDGSSLFPATVESGAVVTDEAGLIYELQPGEFLFPVVAPGTYTVVVSPPANYLFPSSFPEESFTTLDNAPFTIVEASFGDAVTFEATGPANFDIPLDPTGNLIVTKQAGIGVTSVGDFVGYTVSVENRNDVPVPLSLQDTLPVGFRFEPRTARRDGVSIDNPDIAPNGRQLTFDAGVLLPGQTTTVSYIAAVGAGAPLGEAVNEVIAVNTAGAPISNRGEAAVIVQEDLLRSRLTIIGQVAADACDPDENWSREIKSGIGVPGVRLYLETGEFVVTDENGLYHFEDIEPRTHVIQVDEATLPEGYEPVVCEENTRFAGSAISQFVDVQGGVIWRANFYLRRAESAATPSDLITFEQLLEHEENTPYSRSWLNRQSSEPAWAYPEDGQSPASRSTDVGIVHPAGGRVELSVNGQRVHAATFLGRRSSSNGLVDLSRWHGVNLVDGRNEFTAVVYDRNGTAISTLTHVTWFVSEVSRVTLVDDQSVLVADGRTPPVIAVRVEDADGHAVHAGRVLDVNVSSPYRLNAANLFEDSAPVTSIFTNDAGIDVDEDGIARIELAPTLQTGRVQLRVRTDDGRDELINVFLQAEKRDWILVGLAEGEGGFTQLEDTRGSDLIGDGRVAFFAKGVIKGDFLLTLAVDTAEGRGDVDDELFEDIDPNAFYTLYGDRSFQDHEAESAFPVYVKLEKKTFFAVFGDYDTGFSDSVLSRYNRRLAGLQTVYEGKNVSASGFVADTNQGFAREEFAADGTSGPINLATAPLVRNSETVIVETRDRFRPDVVLSTRSMARFTDYDIDFDTGEIVFRFPVNVNDENFNPNVIVVEYETFADVERNLTAGARLEARGFNERVEVGATYIREAGNDVVAESVSEQVGVDLRLQLDDYTEVRAEYATTDSSGGTGDAASSAGGDAILAEVTRRQEALTVGAFYRREEAGFGLGQITSATGGFERFGAEAGVQIAESINPNTGARTTQTLSGRFTQEEQLTTGNERRSAEALWTRDGPSLGLQLGVRNIREELATNDGKEFRRSTLLTSGIRKTFNDYGLSLSATHEQPLGGNDESTQFPRRTILGADKTLGSRATLSVRHEFLDGENASGQNTVAGLSVRPWRGAEISAVADTITSDSGRRIGATVGVDQSFQINQNWSAGFGVANRSQIADGLDGGEPIDVTPDAALSPLETAPTSPLTGTDGFTSAYLGAGFRNERTASSARFEVRDSAIGTRFAGILGGARESSERLSLALAARVERDVLDSAPNARNAEARLGLAYRTGGGGVTIFDRFDVVRNEVEGVRRNTRLVNNFGLNTYITERTQLAAFYGLKFSETSIGTEIFNGFTQLAGGEVRHDIRPWLDVGFAGSALINHNTGTTDFTYGPSIGVSPKKGLWFSIGYNIDGFSDQDFQDAEFRERGFYLKLRFKFDQHTAQGLLDAISPGRGN